MPKISFKSKEPEESTDKSHSEIFGFVLCALAILLILALVSFHQQQPEKNLLGLVGYFTSFILNYLIGIQSFMLAFFLIFWGTRHLLKDPFEDPLMKVIFFALFLLSSCILLSLMSTSSWFYNLKKFVLFDTAITDGPYPTRISKVFLGGVIADYLYQGLPYFNLKILLTPTGTFCTFLLILLISLMSLFEISPLALVDHIKDRFQKLKKEAPIDETASFSVSNVESIRRVWPRKLKAPEEEEAIVELDLIEPVEPIKKRLLPKIKASELAPAIKLESKKKITTNGYDLPPITLLTDAKKVDQPLLKKDLERQARILEDTLLSFGIEGKVGEINCGPTITSFEVHPAIGVKVQKIKALENDIALNLQAKSIRIIAPIPGKAAVGVEIPSPTAQEVGFKQMLISYRNNPKKFHIPVLLGKTVSGEEVICDLSKMPHCLIAGATGSGKSVCINTIIMSILMNASPDEIKLILVDPKKVELTPFSHLPHLIAPVITEPNGAYSALKWIVQEMQLRYEILKQLGVRNIHAFNTRKQDLQLEQSLSIPVPEKMFHIVAIIDEFADLMMSTNADLETPIARIAQMARAVGIHLVLATQRPSREVITGLIKANFPTRIAFKVASRINSQIILDENGAEALLGNGDMLFLPPGTSQILRAQGVYIRDEDINRVVSFIQDQRPANYLIQSFDALSEDPLFAEDGEENEGSDSLYSRALETVVQHNNASTTFLQRKLKIGYARAASLIDELESKGIISPPDGAKARKVLIRPDII
ncbi:MAG: DNA translocase FtsK [Chlamydiae bacterium]|nr:DNA translocase FtsK [Chlamydiota bacterium]